MEGGQLLLCRVECEERSKVNEVVGMFEGARHHNSWGELAKCSRGRPAKELVIQLGCQQAF